MASTPSVPGRTARCRSARAAIGVRRGSTTTTLAPARRRSSITGDRCGCETLGLAPHTTISWLCWRSDGSADAIEPYVRSHASPTTAAQIVMSVRAAPKCSHTSGDRPERPRLPADELYRYGTTDCQPCVSDAWPTLPANRSSASSQRDLANSPEPFGPTRRSGCVTRSGPWRSCGRVLDLGADPAVGHRVRPVGSGVEGDHPAVLDGASRLQLSGQSSVHAVIFPMPQMRNGAAGQASQSPTRETSTATESSCVAGEPNTTPRTVRDIGVVTAPADGHVASSAAPCRWSGRRRANPSPGCTRSTTRARRRRPPASTHPAAARSRCTR